MRTRVLLAGAGHAHLEVLRRCGLTPHPDLEITVVSPGTTHVYSGMVPGYLAGLYSFEEVSVRIEPICRFGGARFVSDYVSTIDRKRRVLVTASGEELGYDLLSLNLGSRALGATQPDVVQNAVVAKPFYQVHEIRARLESLANDRRGSERSIWIVGGGAAGVELALAAAAVVERHASQCNVRLVEGGDCLLRGYERRVQQLASSTLKQRGVEVRLGVKVTMLSEHQVHLADNTTHSADLVLWITGAEPSISLAESGLQVDRRGFVLVRDTLQAVDDERIFAVGDSATLEHAPETPKAGVYAVRQSPMLYSNLLAVANGSIVLQRFHPQASYLSLLNCCDGTAILRYKCLKLRAGWAWRLKDRIDRRFMRRYQLLDPGLGTSGARPR